MNNPRKSKSSRTPDLSPKLLLKEVIGPTTWNANGLASNPSTRSCAYVSGCVVVIYDVDAYTQSHLMVSHRTPKPLTCVAVSHDGRSIAAAEAGNQASVLVWDCASLKLICDLQGHLHGVSCIAFSPDGKHLVAVGGYIYLWDWRRGRLATKIRASLSSSTISSVTFSPDAKRILTAGKKHFKTFSVRLSPRVHLKAGTDSVREFGKSINGYKESSFASVSSVVGIYRTPGQVSSVYALSEEGILCLVQSGSIRNSVDLKVKKGFSVAASDRLVACGCDSGLVQLVHSETLQYSGSLSYNPDYDETGVCGTKTSQKDFRMRDDLPDALACQFTTSERLAVLYSNHSLNIWDIHDASKAVRCCVLVSHTDGIWNVETLCCGSLHDASLACGARGCSSPISFATCSSDGSVRLWDFDWQTDPLKNASSGHLLNRQSQSVSAGIFESNTAQLSLGGFRSLAISEGGEYLAAGDFHGNLHIFNLISSDYTCVKDSHNSEILSLSFSFSGMHSVSNVKNEHNYFLASGGRDRVIHLYDVRRNFERLASVKDHSAAVTSVKLTKDGCKLLSCSADGSIIIRELALREGSVKILHSHRQTASGGTFYDMALDAKGQVVITVGQDQKINMFHIPTGKLLRSFKHGKDGGMPAKISVDPSSSYIACSCGNCINVYNYENGELITQAAGHSDAVTGVIFLPDCRHLISVGADGCIFVWKLPSAFTSRMTKNIEKTFCPLISQSFALSEAKVERGEPRKDTEQMLRQTSERTNSGFYNAGNHQWTPTFNFTVSKLPRWAQQKIVSAGSSEAASLLQRHIQTPIRCDPTEGLPCLNASSASPDTVDSKSSILPQKRLSITSKRWLTVYTVCMDFPNSPHTATTKDDNFRVSNSCGNHGMMNGCCGQSGCDGVVREDPEIREKSHQFRWENGWHVGSSNVAFDRQQGELTSAVVDHDVPKTGKSDPSSRLFVVGEVHHEVDEIALKNSTDGSIQEEMDKQVSLGHLPGREVVESDNSSITRSLSGESAQQKLIECCRALINLDMAVSSAADLCSHVADTASAELFSEPGSELSTKAALLLPSIYEKLNTIGRSLQVCVDSSNTRETLP